MGYREECSADGIGVALFTVQALAFDSLAQ